MMAIDTDAVHASCDDIAQDIAYVFDGTIEGLFSAIFYSYEHHENPSDVYAEGIIQPRLDQCMKHIDTNPSHAKRVRIGIESKLGTYTYRCILKAFQSTRFDAPFAIYQFVHYAIDLQTRKQCSNCPDIQWCKDAKLTQKRSSCPRARKQAISDIAHPLVRPLHEMVVSVNSECEKIRQFARFKHLRDETADLWFAKVNPKASVVPFVLDHFVERFNIQPFILFDEVHFVAGVWDSKKRYFVDTSSNDLLSYLPEQTRQEVFIQKAWTKFYRAVAIESRYNPELRRSFMPKRFWSNLVEMQEDIFGIERHR